MIIARHPEGLGDTLVLDGWFEHHPFGELIDQAWLAIYARPARTEEVASARAFLERQTAELGSKKAATAELVRVLFNTNEFLYVD